MPADPQADGARPDVEIPVKTRICAREPAVVRRRDAAPVGDIVGVEAEVVLLDVEAGAQIENAPGEIGHEFVAVTADDKLERLAEQLRRERGLALVFVRTKHGADKLARKLSRQHNVPTVVMHGNMSQNARERSLAQFESGRVSTLVATDVAARGLDVDDITHVINFDPPHSDDDYVHRVGRTGRAGRSGTGVTFVTPEQRADVARLAKNLGHADAFAASGMTVAAAAGAARRGTRNRNRNRR